MGQILGSNQLVMIDTTGVGTSYLSLVCLSNSTTNVNVDVATEQTNCGVLSSVGEPSITVDFDAVCEATPTGGTQVSYSSLLSASVNKTKIKCKVSSPVVTGSSAGAAYYHEFDAYVSSLTLTSTAGEYVKFSGTVTSTGTIDITA